MTIRPAYYVQTRSGRRGYVQRIVGDMAKLYSDVWNTGFPEWHHVHALHPVNRTYLPASPYHPNGPQPPEIDESEDTDGVPY